MLLLFLNLAIAILRHPTGPITESPNHRRTVAPSHRRTDLPETFNLEPLNLFHHPRSS
ncbi:MAG: hypothetical protein RL693_2060, partial [Verrucomicrobiota bacterium]